MPVLGTIEEQYTFLLKDYYVIVSILENVGFKQITYPNEKVITIYFSDENHRVPNSAYIRARKYASESHEDLFKVDMESIYNLEIKSKRLSSRKKIKIEIPFGNIIDLFSNIHTDRSQSISVIRNIWNELDFKKLIPFIATQYVRRHFEKNGLRVTLDTGIKIFGFEKNNNSKALKILEDKINGKFEIKSDTKDKDIIRVKKYLFSQCNLNPTRPGSAEKNYRQYYNFYFSKASKTLH